MTKTEQLNWQARIKFYGKKIEQYKAKYPNRNPSQSTVKRWAREYKEMLERS